jgi:hypothetical protein
MLEARVPPHPLPHSSTNPTVPTSPFFRKKKRKTSKCRYNWAKQVESKSHTSKELHATYEEEMQ